MIGLPNGCQSIDWIDWTDWMMTNRYYMRFPGQEQDSGKRNSAGSWSRTEAASVDTRLLAASMPRSAVVAVACKQRQQGRERKGMVARPVAPEQPGYWLHSRPARRPGLHEQSHHRVRA